jgi:poly-beta-1,6-N-acetyl-D-glucosamine synthase
MQWLPVILILPYFFLLLKICRGLYKIKTFRITSDPVTFISVIIACRNEQENLPALLKSISEQDYPADLFEVIIVDDNSVDKTYEIASSFHSPLNTLTLYNIGKGKKDAIRTGVSAASGLLIITTDADCVMGKRWLRNIAAFSETCKPDMIICPVRLETGKGFFKNFQELEFLSLQGITAGTASLGNAIMCNGANLSFTSESYRFASDDIHPEIASGDDVFLLHSLKKKSDSKIFWLESSEVMVTAASSPTIKPFFKQRKRWISKSTAYKDEFTICLGIVTFVTILLQASCMAGAIIYQTLIPVFLLIFLLKSIPDFLILWNTTVRYRRQELMIWFIPSQIIYPFYVLGVVIYSLIFSEERTTSSPSPTET